MATKASFTKTYHRKAYSSIDPSSPQLSHYGRAVLVTGAGSGIGRATAIAYAKAGAKHVILVGRRTDKLEDTQTEIKSLCKGTDISCHTIDIVDSDAVSTLFKSLPTIDILFNAAGSGGPKGLVRDLPASTFFAEFDVNIRGLYNLAHAFLNQQPASSDPALTNKRVFISCTTQVAHLPCNPFVSAAYVVSKCAASKFIEALSAEEKDVRFYSMHPGTVETEMSVEAIKPYTAEQLGIVWDKPEVAAGMAVWLSKGKHGGEGLRSGALLWANWDVDELWERREELEEDTGLLTMGLMGWGQEMPEKVL